MSWFDEAFQEHFKNPALAAQRAAEKAARKTVDKADDLFTSAVRESSAGYINTAVIVGQTWSEDLLLKWAMGNFGDLGGIAAVVTLIPINLITTDVKRHIRENSGVPGWKNFLNTTAEIVIPNSVLMLTMCNGFNNPVAQLQYRMEAESAIRAGAKIQESIGRFMNEWFPPDYSTGEEASRALATNGQRVVDAAKVVPQTSPEPLFPQSVNSSVNQIAENITGYAGMSLFALIPAAGLTALWKLSARKE